MNWYYAHDGKHQGPVPEETITQLASSGMINADTLVWKEGMGDWQPLAQALPSALSTAPVNAPQIGGYAVPAAQKDIYVQQMREGVMTRLPGTLDYAGFWIRFVAKFIDNMIVMIFLAIILGLLAGGLYAAGVPIEPGPQGEPPPAGFVILMIAYYIVAFGLQVAYPAFLVAKYGATWGKMALGLKVVNEDGSNVTTGRAVGRGFAELLNQFTCTIGYIIAGFDDQKRALHDHVCSTRVIKTR